MLLKTIIDSQSRYSCIISAWSILPNHFHLLIDVNDSNISQIMHYIKQSFAVKYKHRIDKSIRRIWQYRFWDHIIRNQDDYYRHLDYIHYNPVKHGLSKSPFEYQYSSLGNFKDNYPSDWGIHEPDNLRGLDYE